MSETKPINDPKSLCRYYWPKRVSYAAAVKDSLKRAAGKEWQAILWPIMKGGLQP
jgi:hypothetical protein